MFVILRIHTTFSATEKISTKLKSLCEPLSGQIYANNAEKRLLKTFDHVQPRTIPTPLTLFSDRIR